MELLPLTSLILALFFGSPTSSDSKSEASKDLFGKQAAYQVEEHQQNDDALLGEDSTQIYS